MTREEFAPVVAYLAAAVGKPVPREQAEVYFDLLKDLPFAAVELAAKRALLESAYPTVPPVGVLRRLATGALNPPEPLWGEAWEQAIAAVRRYDLSGERRGLESLPVPVARAARAIGWRALCDCNPADCSTLRAQFRDVYQSLAEREAGERRLPAPVREAVARIGGRLGALPPPG